MDRWGPLDGIRVLDFSWVVAGPQASRILGDFGAQIVKVEYAGRPEPMRFYDSTPGLPAGSLEGSGIFNNLNRNKLSLALNAVHPEGLALLKQIIALSDVVLENFRPRVMGSWGLGYDEMVKINPAIVYVSLSGFGHTGRNAGYTTWGPTAQALSGLTLMSGLPGRPPAGWGFSYMDHSAGYYGAAAVLQALYHRQQTGEGQYVDCSQVECGIVLTGPAILDYSVNGRPYRRPGNPPGNRSSHPVAAPHNVYPCAGEDRWIAITVFTDEQWAALRCAMGDPGWAAEGRFATVLSRRDHQDELDVLMAAWTAEQDARELMLRLQAAGVPAGMVQNVRDRVEDDPQLRARGFYHELDHPLMGRRLFEGMPVTLSDTPASLRRAAPMLGEHNSFVLGDLLGIPDAQLARLAEEAVF